MPSIESSFMATRKQEDNCWLGVPALKSVGEAWVKNRSLICRTFQRDPEKSDDRTDHVVRLDGALDVFTVDADGDAHEHVLGPLGNFAVDAEQVGPLERLEAKVGLR
jgi:hypothetical protein